MIRDWLPIPEGFSLPQLIRELNLRFGRRESRREYSWRGGVSTADKEVIFLDTVVLGGIFGIKMTTNNGSTGTFMLHFAHGSMVGWYSTATTGMNLVGYTKPNELTHSFGIGADAEGGTFTLSLSIGSGGWTRILLRSSIQRTTPVTLEVSQLV